MSGPVILMTDGFKASALVSRITSPRPIAADSFSSGVPSSSPFRNIGQIGEMPWWKIQVGQTSVTHIKLCLRYMYTLFNMYTLFKPINIKESK